MSTAKYKELDDAICEHIAQGRGHATNSSALEEIAKPLLASNKTPFPVAWRLIDRRMQTMRKDGRLVYERTKGGGHGRWRVVTYT
jgi:DNA-binding transcriptional regulator PaaX